MSEANPEHVEPPENEDDNTVVTEARIDEFSEAVEHDARDYLVSEMADMHPADIADVMEQMPRHLALDMVELLGQSLSYEALTELDVDLRTEALERLPDNVLAEAIEELDSDDAAEKFVNEFVEFVRAQSGVIVFSEIDISRNR